MRNNAQSFDGAVTDPAEKTGQKNPPDTCRKADARGQKEGTQEKIPSGSYLVESRRMTWYPCT